MIKKINRLLAAAVILTALWSAFASQTVYARQSGNICDIRTESASDIPASRSDEGVSLIGEPVGVRLFSDGVMISDTAGVITEAGTVSPAGESGLNSGDIITAVDGRRVASSDQVVNAVEQSNGNTLTFSVRHSDGAVETVSVTPVYSIVDSRYRVGIWIRDGTAGIGVISFITTGSIPGRIVFGAVGHALTDDAFPGIQSPDSGVINSVTLTGIRKGVRGTPGELIGYLGTAELGTVTVNSSCGLFGYMDARGVPPAYGGRVYGVASKNEVNVGPAQLIVRLPGENCARPYSVVIESINGDSSNTTRNMIVRVTDKTLSAKTGGIVQGMSGSPIVQNGRFAAVVTHVFIGDPTRGYAIFAENMTDYSNTLRSVN